VGAVPTRAATAAKALPEKEAAVKLALVGLAGCLAAAAATKEVVAATTGLEE